MKKYNSYLPSILSFVFMSVFVISMWHVKSDLENGYCDYDNGECCAHWLIGDGTCDQRNNFQVCGNYDGGDCRPPNITKWPDCLHNPELISNNWVASCKILVKIIARHVNEKCLWLT